MATGLNTGGWIFILTAWTTIIAVTIFCAYKILFRQKSSPTATDDEQHHVRS